jgi:hypothetical protein
MLTKCHRDNLKEYLPFMDRLTPSEHELIMENASAQRFEAGGVLQANGDECRGLTLVLSAACAAFTSPREARS